MFEYSFVASFHFKRLQEEYIKVRDDYAINDNLNVFWNIFALFSGKKPEDLPDFIRLLSAYVMEDIAIEKKVLLENVVREHPNILNPEYNFGIDQLNGCFCHSIREILFDFGCVNNMSYFSIAEFNVKQHYRYLVQKKRYLNNLKGKLRDFC